MMVRRKAEISKMFEPAQGQALRWEGEIGRVAKGGAKHDDQRADEEHKDRGGEGDQGRVEFCGHQTAMGLRRLAMRVISSTMAMVMTTMIAAMVEADTQSKVTMAC